jgi:predicted alpha/beta superfamily hydrolase
VEIDYKILDFLIVERKQCMEWIFKSGLSQKKKAKPGEEDSFPLGARQGRFKMFYNFASRFVPSSRNIVIFLPPSYWTVKRHYPVVYMHDGNNLFDPRTAFCGCPWGLDWFLDEAWKKKTAEEFIVVGISNTVDRHEEYTPTWDIREKAGGLATSYFRFIAEELKPLVDKRFRTLTGPEHTCIGGSSLGGLVSLYGAFSRPDVFGKAAVVSPSLWWDEGFMFGYLALKANNPRYKNSKIWIDMGTKEGSIPKGMEVAPVIQQIRQVKKILLAGGFKESQIGYLEVKDGIHNERHWGKRSGQIFSFLFKKKRKRKLGKYSRTSSKGN